MPPSGTWRIGLACPPFRGVSHVRRVGHDLPMSNRTSAKTDHTELYSRLYGADFATRGVVTEATGCHYVAEWVGSETGTRRNYRRTTAEHAWNRQLTECKRCGKRWADC